MRLPVEWNGRFLHQVNGGNDGAVLPAIGDQPKALASGGFPALARGFAVLSSDSGHSGTDPANKPLGLARGGLRPRSASPARLRLRRGHDAGADCQGDRRRPLRPQTRLFLHVRLFERGRHTMVAAERMPEAYDGFLVGDPGFDLPRAAIQHAWDAQAFVKADPDIRKSITKEEPSSFRVKSRKLATSLTGSKMG